VAESLRIKVIAPVPRFDYAKLHQARVAAPSSRMDGEIEVFHPEWLYPPGGHAANAVLLFLQLLPLVRRIRKEFRFDLIDAHFAFPDGIAACLLARHFRVPFTVTLRGNETMHAAYAMRGRLIAWALKQASRVIGVSSKLREFAISLGVDEAKVRVIPNGIDATVFRPRGRGIREECHLSEADNIVLSAGTLIERKGHHRVVRAVAALRRGGIDAKLLIAGGPGREGRFESEIQKEVESSGLESSVQFLGEVRAERLAELMSAADVFCLASSREGWPNVVNEALACGAPVVATEVGAVRDLIPSADYGFVVPLGDENALENALAGALSKAWDREKISAWGHSRSWEQVASDVVAEFQSVMEARAGKAAIR
jgi:glycosyltransferase involved in cell wall biosynthesis